MPNFTQGGIYHIKLLLFESRVSMKEKREKYAPPERVPLLHTKGAHKDPTTTANLRLSFSHAVVVCFN
jgi:hypothetical protein